MELKLIYTTCILLVYISLVKSCDVRPKDWCDTEDNARKCEVYDQCMKYVWKSKGLSTLFLTDNSTTDLVDLSLYYESLCPDCKNFILKQLYPVMQKVGSIVNLVLIPYGNAHQKMVGSKWSFICQHGPEECYGNLIQTCTIHFYPDVTTHFNFIHCMEISGSLPEISWPKCAHEFGLDYNLVKMCVNSSLGNMLEHKMGDLTEALQPPHTFVPWITLNGVHTTTIQKEAETHLLKLICDAYKGSMKPQACMMKRKTNNSL